MRDAAAKSRAKSKTLRETPELVEPEPEDKEPGATTEQEWWAQNIAKLERQNPELLAQHKAQRELCLDQIHWMKVGHNWDTNDPDFVDLEEGYADLEEFVATHGLVHNGIFIGVEGHVEKELVGRELWKADYWKYPKAMRALAASSPATAIYMRTGIMTAVPDWFYRQFKNRINKYGAIGVPSDFPRFELDRGRWFYKD